MKKDLLLVASIIFFSILLYKGVDIQTVDEYYLLHLDDITPDSETVTLTIRADTAVDNFTQLAPPLQDERYVPEDGIILETTKYVLRPKDTVFDILLRATRHEQIPLTYQGAEENQFGSVYIQGINHLYEFSCGPLSGWMYEVNGVFPDYGVSKYTLEDGDSITFHYTCDLGRDIKEENLNEEVQK